MARVIGLMGESAAGKTTSLETLNPKTTFIVDADKKGLPFQKKVREAYGEDKLNYFKTDNPSTILTLMDKINNQDNMKHIKVLVVDTINAVMIGDEARRRKEKSYDKWADLAWAVYDILDYALTMRDDLTVIFIAHVQVDREDDGYRFAHIKTSGKKLDKIGIETKLNIVFYAKAKPDGEYVFETHANNSTAKTPRGAFKDDEIPNDMAAVLKVLEEY